MKNRKARDREALTPFRPCDLRSHGMTDTDTILHAI